MTDPALPSGSDRVWAAVQKVDPRKRHDIIINLQGDAPDLTSTEIQAVLEPFADESVQITTIVAPLKKKFFLDENVVKAITATKLTRVKRLSYAKSFSRKMPANTDWCYHHVGIYGYRRDALARFVEMKPSAGEIHQRLEQLRALEAGMRIAVRLIDRVPLEVNTPADLRRANRLMRA